MSSSHLRPPGSPGQTRRGSAAGRWNKDQKMFLVRQVNFTVVLIVLKLFEQLVKRDIKFDKFIFKG